MVPMRPSLLPCLVAAVRRNMDRGFADIALCEVGPQYHGLGIDGQLIVASGIRRGQTGPRHWRERPRAVDAYDARADAAAALAATGVVVEQLMVMDGVPDW